MDQRVWCPKQWHQAGPQRFIQAGTVSIPYGPVPANNLLLVAPTLGTEAQRTSLVLQVTLRTPVAHPHMPLPSPLPSALPHAQGAAPRPPCTRRRLPGGAAGGGGGRGGSGGGGRGGAPRRRGARRRLRRPGHRRAAAARVRHISGAGHTADQSGGVSSGMRGWGNEACIEAGFGRQGGVSVCHSVHWGRRQVCRC